MTSIASGSIISIVSDVKINIMKGDITMLRKSKSGDGYSLTMKISEKESQQITLYATVKNVTPAEAAKQIVFNNLRLTDSEKANLAKLVG